MLSSHAGGIGRDPLMRVVASAGPHAPRGHRRTTTYLRRSPLPEGMEYTATLAYDLPKNIHRCSERILRMVNAANDVTAHGQATVSTTLASIKIYGTCT